MFKLNYHVECRGQHNLEIILIELLKVNHPALQAGESIDLHIDLIKIRAPASGLAAAQGQPAVCQVNCQRGLWIVFNQIVLIELSRGVPRGQHNRFVIGK